MARILASLLLVCLSGASAAREYVWIIGGGGRVGLGDSQAQIELNVEWVIRAVKDLVPDAKLLVYYANGNGPAKSVTERNPEFGKNTFEPLARVFGQREANATTYHPQRVPGVLDTTEVKIMGPELRRQFASLNPGDRALIVYNGHGHAHGNDAVDSTLWLWGGTELWVRDFAHLLDNITPAVPVRFVMTQCYAGGFARVVHPNADDTLRLTRGPRCGFMAVAKDREAEGCSASVDIGDYRDYTTYFFAALFGRTRLGQALKYDPDVDHNGVVTLREAHLYALSEAQNTDIPRSTSEVFLDRWQPWYLRWLATGALPDNTYGRLARRVSRENGLPEDGNGLIRGIDARQRRVRKQTDALKAEQTKLTSEVARVQETIRRDIQQRWPEALYPYTASFSQFINTDLSLAEEYIVHHPLYKKLAAEQDRLDEIEKQLLHLRRADAELERILRLRALARALNQFERFANSEERSRYEQLLRCEELPL